MLTHMIACRHHFRIKKGISIPDEIVCLSHSELYLKKMSTILLYLLHKCLSTALKPCSAKGKPLKGLQVKHSWEG